MLFFRSTPSNNSVPNNYYGGGDEYNDRDDEDDSYNFSFWENDSFGNSSSDDSLGWDDDDGD